MAGMQNVDQCRNLPSNIIKPLCMTSGPIVLTCDVTNDVIIDTYFCSRPFKNL